MPSNVSRRDFLRIVTGSIISLPSVATATVATVPHVALAATQQETGTDDTLYTNEVQLVPLTLSEVAFVVCDVSIGDPSKNRVAGAHVRVISLANGKAVEGTTAADGSVMFDIKELALCKKGESRDDLKKYHFIGMIEITCEGYRDFVTGQFLVEGLQTHVIPTQRLQKDWPYPARASFDGWDVLYVDNTPTFNKGNTELHTLAFTIKNANDSDKVTASLVDKTANKVLHTTEAFPSGGEFSGGFTKHFLQEGHPDALAVGTDYCIRFSQRDKTWEFDIRLKPKASPFPELDKPAVLKPAKALKPVGDPKGGKTSATLPRVIPTGGGGSISSWIPDLGPVQIGIDPIGSATIAVTVGQVEYPWGESNEWSIPPAGRPAAREYKIDEGSVTGISSGDNLEFKENEGWKWFPQKTLAKQWEEQKTKIRKGMNNYRAARQAQADDPTQRTISFSKVLKVNAKVQLFGILTWDILDKDTGEISFSDNPGFSGVAGMALILSAAYTYSNNFLAGPVPVLFQFGFNLSASVKATAGLTVRDTDEKRQEEIKAGQPVKSWSEILGNWDYWNWDFTNTGFSLTITFSPWISLGVGVKGVASVSVRGSIAITYYVAASFPLSALGPGRENPHMILGVSAGLDLVFELFFFTYNLSVVDLSNKNFYNSWNDPQWQPDKWEIGKYKLYTDQKAGGLKAQSDEEAMLNEAFMRAMLEDDSADIWGEVTSAFNDAQMDEMLQKMTPITDDMMLETAEAGSVSAMSALSDEDAPRQVVTVSYVEDSVVTDDGIAIPAIVYAFESAQEYEERLEAEALAAEGQATEEDAGAATEAEAVAPDATVAEAVAPDATEDASVAAEALAAEGQAPVAEIAADAEQAAVLVAAAVADDGQAADALTLEDAASEPAALADESLAALTAEPTANSTAEPDAAAVADDGQAADEQAEPQANENTEAQAEEQAEEQADEDLEAQADDESASPFSYACPEYERYWESPVGDLFAMADENPVVGIGDEGGVVLSNAYDTRLNPEGTPVFGSQRMQVLHLGGGSVITLRIGVVSMGGQPRTRVIITKVAGSSNVGLSSVLDFKIIKPQINGPAYNALEEAIEGYRREDLYDYEFSAQLVEEPNASQYLQIAVLSGKRDLAGAGSNAEKLAQSATDLVLTWIYADISRFTWTGAPEPGTSALRVVRNFSWPGKMIFGDDGKYHSISNLQLNYDRVAGGTEYVSTTLQTGLITFLDRSAASAADTLSHKDGVATIRLGMLFVARYSAGHWQTDRFYALAYPPAQIETLMGAITDGSTHELRFWSRSDDHYTFMVRGAEESRYYVLQIEPGSAALAAHGNEISAKIKNIRLVATEDGTTRLHHWRDASGTERYLGTRADQSGLASQAEGEENDGGIDRELCLFTLNGPDGTAPKFDFHGIGPKDFSLSSFVANGDFIYWPGTKNGFAGMKPTQADNEANVELVDDNPVERSWLVASRLRNGTFSEPFYVVDLMHNVDHIVSVTNTSYALDVVCCGLTDRERGKADIFHTRIPFIRCVTATHALVETQYVVHGRDAKFFITLRNDGNTFIGGCTVEMWHEGNVVGTSQLAFSKETITESTYNPAKAGRDELEDVEPDYALAPGKTSVYSVNFKIPDSWVGGVNESGERIVKTVKFRACQPTTKVSTPGTMVAQAEGFEEEGIEYSVPLPQVPIEAVPIELYEYDHMSHDDAPVRLLGESDKEAVEPQPSKGDKRSAQTLPQTGDVGGLGIGAALSAAAGAALVAYGRRRAENEGAGTQEGSSE